MADIDDELLALAGGDSEDEGSGNESRQMSESPPPVNHDSADNSGKKAKRRPRRDESEEEGEASSAASSPNSLESAPMDESDSDAEPTRGRASGGDDDDKYPVDGMFESHAEKAQIMAMREVDREQILADRASEVERRRQNALLRRMVTNVENEERKHPKKKRSADTAELEDVERKGSRQRTGKGGETAMDSLRRARAEKQRRREDQERRKDNFSPGRRESLDPESDDDFGRHQSRTPEPEKARDAPPADVRDFDRVRLGRNEFARVCFTPKFEQAITGCYIRIALGPHPDTGVEQYRMAVIKGFTAGRPYALSGPNGSFVTDQYVRAAHGKAIKEFPFIAASSGSFSENELSRYQVTCQNDTVTLPSAAYLQDKIDEINSLINHTWTSEDIKTSLSRKNELRKRFDPEERSRVAQLHEDAIQQGDNDRAEELKEQLDKMGTQRLAFKTSLGPSKHADSTRATTEQDRLAERNRENRRLNADSVRKAQLKDRAKSREIELAMKRGEQVAEDPSRRLRTKAKFVHDINDKGEMKSSANGSGASTPANGTPMVGATKSQMLPHLTKLQEKNYSENKGVPTIHKPLMDDDVIGALDLDIDIEI